MPGDSEPRRSAPPSTFPPPSCTSSPSGSAPRRGSRCIDREVDAPEAYLVRTAAEALGIPVPLRR